MLAGVSACRSSNSAAADSTALAQKNNTESSQSAPSAGKSTVIVMLADSASQEPVLAKAKEIGAELVYRYDVINALALELPKGYTFEKALETFKNVKGVVSVERDQTLKPM